MRVIEPVENAPLRICVGPVLATPARVAQLSSLLGDASDRQPRETTKAARLTGKTLDKPAKPPQSNSCTVHTICCCSHQHFNDDTLEQEDAQHTANLSATIAVGRAVKVKLDDGKWYARRGLSGLLSC